MPTMTLTPEEERDNLERCVALANDYRGTSELYDGDGAAKTRVLARRNLFSSAACCTRFRIGCAKGHVIFAL